MSIKRFFRNYLLEQDENVVQVSPEQYIETLENVGGIADRIAKLKPYRGKSIVITGSLNVSKHKNISINRRYFYFKMQNLCFFSTRILEIS